MRRHPIAAALAWWLRRRAAKRQAMRPRTLAEIIAMRSEPSIVIDRVTPIIGRDVCIVMAHERHTGRVRMYELPRTPGESLESNYDYLSACCGAPVTYPESRKTT